MTQRQDEVRREIKQTPTSHHITMETKTQKEKRCRLLFQQQLL